MRRKFYIYSIIITVLIAAITSAYYGAYSRSVKPIKLDWYGAWVKTNSITSQERIDQMLDNAEAGGFNVLLVNVVYEGFAYYNSKLLPKSPKIEAEFDPLAYLVPEAHRRGIEVHAWFMVGKFGDEKKAPFFEDHPEWAMQAPDGEKTYWLNFNLPEVRDFLQEIMVETVEQYGVNGLHFDYTRYPGDQWGFDPYSLQDFKEKSGIDADLLRFESLPAYGFLEGNPLDTPTSAQVLAKFSNGLPAITLNQYGDGQVLLFNWDATERHIAVSSEVLSRAMDQFAGPEGAVGIFHSETNAAEYGLASFDAVQHWIEYLGRKTQVVPENELSALASLPVVIMPNIYLITPDSAADLEAFVHQGGNVIFIDGPTKSIYLPAIQAITGMSSRSKYFNMATMINAYGTHALIPSQPKSYDLETYQSWIVKWTEYRQENINTLIKDIYKQVKARHPQTEISVTITSNIDEAGSRYMEDWRDWMRYGYIDLLIPRGYADSPQELVEILRKWESPIETNPTRIKVGLITYTDVNQVSELKSPEELIREIEILERAGLKGFLLFHLDQMSYIQLNAIKNHYPQKPES
jgi:uncharacterized lipoprotein YddW (UPF0748 family)